MVKEQVRLVEVESLNVVIQRVSESMRIEKPRQLLLGNFTVLWHIHFSLSFLSLLHPRLLFLLITHLTSSTH
jgi:hypothetical protein